MTEEITVEERFYRQVAEILGCDDHYYAMWPFSKKTRWNNRNPGNGRYADYGIVRRYSGNIIHVALNKPPLVGIYSNDIDAITAITAAVNSYKLLSITNVISDPTN